MSVSIVRIPPAPDGSKQGIDDYLAAGGDLDDLEVLPFEGGWIPPRDWPTLAKDALQGLAGEVVNTIAPNTESDPVAILALFLAAYGNMIGRGAHFVVEGGQHFCKAWPVITGESGKGRKGTAQDRVNRLLKRVDERWYYNCQAQGLSSGEGLIYYVRDRKIKEGKDGETVVVDEGVVDKRLMLTEPEFAGPLTVMQREGNTLSVVLRMAWDDTTLQTLTKNSPESSTKSHVTIAAHTNKEELLKHLTSAKLGGGIGNRFFFLLVKRSKELPFGGRAAADLWRAVYSDLSSPAPGLFGAVRGRAEAQVRRLATIYAALDCSPEVKISHLLAGLGLFDYSEHISYLLFRGKTGDEIADEILQALQASDEEGMSRNDLINYFNRNVKAARIRAALMQLHRDGWATYEKVKRDGPGAPEERWYASVPE